MATKQFLFDTTFKQPTNQSPQLQFEFTRPFSTVSPGGAALGAGTGASLARFWHHERLLCSTPIVTQYADPFGNYGGFHSVHSAGVALDSTTPMLAYFSADQGQVEIYENVLSVGLGGRVHNHPIAHPRTVSDLADPKRGLEDLMWNQADDVAGVVHYPSSMHVCHGLVVAVCQVRRRLGMGTFTISPNGVLPVPDLANTYDVIGTVSSPTPSLDDVDIDSVSYLYFSTLTGVVAWAIGSMSGSGAARTMRIALSDGTGASPQPGMTFELPLWRPEATSLCYWQKVGSNSLWHVHAISSNSQVGHPRGERFQCQGCRVLSDKDPITEVWIPFADYVLNRGPTDLPHSSNGGRVFIARATRSDVGLPWTLDAGMANPVNLPALPFTTEFGYHAHSAHLERYRNEAGGMSSDGLRLICPVGDVWSNNRVITAYLDDQEGYTNPSLWTIVDSAHGSVGARFQSDGSSYLAVGEANQYIGSAPYGWPGAPAGQVAGCDEMPVPLVRAYPPTGGTAAQQPRLEFTRLYGAGCASPNRNAQNRNFIFNCFHVSCQSLMRGGPFAAHFAPGSQDAAWQDNDAATRLLFSPDGEHWGQCFATNHRGVFPTVFFGNEIVFGSLPTPGRGVRSVSIPTITVAKPLALGCGGTNLLREGDSTLAGIGTGNTVTRITDTSGLPPGVPRPPCAPNASPTALTTTYRCTVPATATDQNVAIFKLTNDGSIPAASKVKVRFWVYPLTPTGTNTIATCWVANVALGRYPATGDLTDPAVRMAAQREEFVLGPLECVGDPVRGWYPVTLDTDTQAVDGSGNRRWHPDDAATGPAITAAIPLGLRLLSRVPTRGSGNETIEGEPPNPTDFLIAFDYVVADTTAQEHPGVPLPLVANPPANSGGEQASVTTFTCSDTAWTIQLVGEVPDDAWDHTDTDRPTGKVLCTLWQSANDWVSVIADPTNHAIVFKSSSGATFSVTAASPEQFYFLRGSPVFIVLRSTAGTLHAFVSVGGTRVVAVEVTGITAPKPTALYFGDSTKANVQPMLWYGGRIDESVALSDEAIKTSLQSLGMLYTKIIPVPPGPPSE